MKELNDIPKKNPFTVPDGYFGELNARLISATTGIEPSEEKKSTMRMLRPYLAVAAAVSVIAVLSFTAIYFSSHGSSSQPGMEITLGEFSDIYLNDIDLLTLEENVIEWGSIQKVTDVSSSDIIDYLISENIDINDIYEHF